MPCLPPTALHDAGDMASCSLPATYPNSTKMQGKGGGASSPRVVGARAGVAGRRCSADPCPPAPPLPAWHRTPQSWRTLLTAPTPSCLPPGR